jgi:hypothetical protein
LALIHPPSGHFVGPSKKILVIAICMTLSVQWIDNGNVRRILLRRAGSAHPETVELHPVLQCPGATATVVVKNKRAEHERLVPGDLGVAQLPLADPMRWYLPRSRGTSTQSIALPLGGLTKQKLGRSLNGSTERTPQLTSTHHSRPAKASTSWSVDILRSTRSP